MVVKNSLNPDWKPEEVFEFDVSKGELVDLKIVLKDWNRLTAIKDLGTATISVEKIKQVLSGVTGPRLGDEFPVTDSAGSPLLGKDKEETFLVLKLKAKEGLPKTAADSTTKVANANEIGTNLLNTPQNRKEGDDEVAISANAAKPAAEPETKPEPVPAP